MKKLMHVAMLKMLLVQQKGEFGGSLVQSECEFCGVQCFHAEIPDKGPCGNSYSLGNW